MVHEADDEAGMKAHTTLLMAKFGITSIPALVLLDKRVGMICADAQDKCVADPEGWAFPWRKQSQSPATARTAGRGPVVNFDLPHGQGCDQNPRTQGRRHLRGARQLLPR